MINTANKNWIVAIRIDESEEAMIREISALRPDLKLNRSAIVRQALHEMYQNIKKEKRA